jgi:Zn-dependent M32 family carboxypeptidase
VAISQITFYTWNEFLQSPQGFEEASLEPLKFAFKAKSIAPTKHPLKTSLNNSDSPVTTDQFELQLRKNLRGNIN